MARGTSPTQRTLDWLRRHGYSAGIVERWNQFVGPHGIRQDLFGFIDIVAVRADQAGVVGIQATSGTNVASRIAKIRGIPESRVWLRAGNRILVVGWRELVAYRKDGTKAARKRWVPKVIELRTDAVVDVVDGENLNQKG